MNEIEDSLIIVPQYFEREYESEIDFLNDQTYSWLWGQIGTGEYLDLVNDTTGDIQRHLNEFERSLKNAGSKQ